MSTAEPWSAYRWAEHDGVLDAYCVSVSLGVSEDEAADAFAVHPATRRLATYAEQAGLSAPYPDGYGNDTVQIDALDGAVVCVESNGWAGVDDARACRLSAGGCSVAAYRSVNADMQFVFARRGEIIRSFDPLLYDSSGALAEEAGLPFGHPGSPTAAAFALIERLTGAGLTREWLIDQAHPTYLRDPET
ncbi:MAG: DUF6461 domain-containing protein [Gaiellales bacterium]